MPPTPEQTAAAGQARDQAVQVGLPTQTSGKVVSLHTVKLVGMPDAHVLVKIQGEDGEMDIADLGTAADLKSNGIEPREGQQLWVIGRVGKINDKALIVAEHLSESKLVTIVRTAPLREESEKHAAARTEGKDSVSGKDGTAAKTVSLDADMQVRTVEGTVIHTRKVKIEGELEEHLFAKLQTESGIVVLDLGAATTLPKVDLGEGQLVAATGFVAHLNSKPIIVADSIGNLSSIQRVAVGAVVPAAAKGAVPEK
ncbi:MAG TPA: hypothetical protein VGP72_02135 [Planctomycetota bacterium]